MFHREGHKTKVISYFFESLRDEKIAAPMVLLMDKDRASFNAFLSFFQTQVRSPQADFHLEQVVSALNYLSHGALPVELLAARALMQSLPGYMRDASGTPTLRCAEQTPEELITEFSDLKHVLPLSDARLLVARMLFKDAVVRRYVMVIRGLAAYVAETLQRVLPLLRAATSAGTWNASAAVLLHILSIAKVNDLHDGTTDEINAAAAAAAAAADAAAAAAAADAAGPGAGSAATDVRAGAAAANAGLSGADAASAAGAAASPPERWTEWSQNMLTDFLVFFCLHFALLCWFHVWKAIKKNVKEKDVPAEHRDRIIGALRGVILKGNSFQEFLATWDDVCPVFCAYVQSEWMTPVWQSCTTAIFRLLITRFGNMNTVRRGAAAHWCHFDNHFHQTGDNEALFRRLKHDFMGFVCVVHVHVPYWCFAFVYNAATWCADERRIS